MNRAALATIDGAAHFMIATHAGEVGRLIGEHVDGVESRNASHHLDFCDVQTGGDYDPDAKDQRGYPPSFHN